MSTSTLDVDGLEGTLTKTYVSNANSL